MRTVVAHQPSKSEKAFFTVKEAPGGNLKLFAPPAKGLGVSAALD